MIGRRNLDEISVAARLEQQGDFALQPRLVALDREMIVRLPSHQITGYCSLGQQSIAGDVPADDVAGGQQRNRHADFVGALLLIAACYRQGAYLFWA